MHFDFKYNKNTVRKKRYSFTMRAEEEYKQKRKVHLENEGFGEN